MSEGFLFLFNKGGWYLLASSIRKFSSHHESMEKKVIVQHEVYIALFYYF